MTRTERQENDMTDEQTTTEAPAEETADATAQEAPADVESEREAEETEQDGKGNREAARYRKQLRETEAERDRLAERVEALQRQAIERIVETEYRGKAAGLWESGVAVADLVDESGAVDPAKVGEAWRSAVDRLGINPLMFDGAYVPGEGRTPKHPAQPGTTWAEIFRDL